jgi:hypothetical protein
MRLTSTRNLLLQNGGTFVDNGQRLQVSGDARITSNTTSGSYRVGFATSNNSPFIFSFDSNAGSPDGTFRNLSFYSYTGSSQALGGSFSFSGDPFSQTSGNQRFLNVLHNFVPTSGTATLDLLRLVITINQTGGANGITRGLYVNPTLTAAADFRAIEWSNNTGWGLYGAGTANNYLSGALGIGSTAVSATSLRIGRSISGATTSFGIWQDGTVQSTVTASVYGIINQLLSFLS